MAEKALKRRSGSRIFFRRGCTRLLLYFNTNKPHSFCRIPVVLENGRSSQGGGAGAHPLHPPPRSAPEKDPIPLRGWLKTICIGNSMICSDIWQKYHE